MRKLKLQMQITVDGFVSGPNGEMEAMTWDWGDDAKQYVTAITEPIDTILIGRKMADGFISYWAAAATEPEAESFALKMRDTPKVVFTHNPQAYSWDNTEVMGGDLAAAITALKSREGADIIAYGGAEFISNLIQTGLIDDLYLCINPVAFGAGRSIFAQLTKLKLVESKAFDCGIVVHHYKMA